MIDVAILRAMAAAGAPMEAIFAAIEMEQKAETGRAIERRTKNAEKQQRHRDKVNAERNRTSPLVTARNGYAGYENALLLTKEGIGLSIKKEREEESKKDIKTRVSKKKLGPMPDGWIFPERAKEIAKKLNLGWEEIAARFQDYIASTGKQYADYDAAVCNFVRNTPKFNGGKHVTVTPVTTEVFAAPAGAPEFDAWKAFYRDRNEKFKIKQMDQAADWGKPMTFPTRWPPNHERGKAA